jgi:hypothetical protein
MSATRVNERDEISYHLRERVGEGINNCNDVSTESGSDRVTLSILSTYDW